MIPLPEFQRRDLTLVLLRKASLQSSLWSLEGCQLIHIDEKGRIHSLRSCAEYELRDGRLRGLLSEAIEQHLRLRFLAEATIEALTLVSRDLSTGCKNTILPAGLKLLYGPRGFSS